MTRADGPPVGRFAPSPTGALHFGSLVAAIASCCDARASGGRWLVRIEDLDEPRAVPGADAGILATLERYGFRADGPILRQSARRAHYDAALAVLAARGHNADRIISMLREAHALIGGEQRKRLSQGG